MIDQDFNNGCIDLNYTMIGEKEIGKGDKNVLGFLMVENQRLKEENEDLREMIKMNKVQIDVLSKGAPKNKYIEIIENYRIANENNQRKIELLQAKLHQIDSDRLVLEQLNSSAASQLKEEERMNWDRIEELQDIIKELQRRIVGLEKNQRSYDTITGFVEKFREVYNPTEQAIDFKARETYLCEESHVLKCELERMKQNEDSLLKVNGILRHKVVTLQAKLAMPAKNFGDILDKSLKRLMMYFIETQRRMLTGEDSDSDGEDDVELIAPELASLYGEDAVRKQKNYNVPAINMLGVRSALVATGEKIKPELIKRNHLSKDERLDLLEKELEFTRRELTKNILQLREETERRKLIDRICEELEWRNELLLQSNRKFEERIAKWTKKVMDSKQKHLKFVELDETIGDISTTIIKVDPSFSRPKGKAEPLKVLSQNINFGDVAEQYKVHIELLARDLAKNSKIQNLAQLRNKKEPEQNEGPRLKRSTSNPFLYFNERREQIMEINKDIGKGGNMRLEQTEIFQMNGVFGHSENLDDIYV